MVVSGTIDAFPIDAYTNALAAALGVAPSDCNVTVVSASIAVFFTAVTPSRTVADAAVATLASYATDVSAATAALGVTVESVDAPTSIVIVVDAPPPPSPSLPPPPSPPKSPSPATPPPSSPDRDCDCVFSVCTCLFGTVPLMYAVFGAAGLVLLLLLLLVYCCCCRGPSRKRPSGPTNAITLNPGTGSTRPIYDNRPPPPVPAGIERARGQAAAQYAARPAQGGGAAHNNNFL